MEDFVVLERISQKEETRADASALFKASDNTWSAFWDHWREGVSACVPVIHPEYLKGFDKLEFSDSRFPTIEHIESKLEEIGWSLILVDGVVEDALFCKCVHNKVFPISMRVRSYEQILHAPEPDAIHDIFGHIPWLFWPEYRRCLALIASSAVSAQEGRASDKITTVRQLRWSRIFLWTIEFGLIGSRDDPKIIGAAIMSSPREMERIMKGVPAIRPLDLSAYSVDILYSDPQPFLYQAADLDDVGVLLEDLDGGNRKPLLAMMASAVSSWRNHARAKSRPSTG